MCLRISGCHVVDMQVSSNSLAAPWAWAWAGSKE